MSGDADRVVDLDQGKIIVGIFCAFLFVGLGFWIVSWDNASIQALRGINNDPLFVRSVGVAAILIALAFLLFGIRNLLNRKPGLVLSSAGFTDNSSTYAAGFIPWSEIRGLRVYKILGQRCLIIHLISPEKYIIRGGPLRRMLMHANASICESPIVISSSTLEIEFDELHQLFQSYISRYCTHHRHRSH